MKIKRFEPIYREFYDLLRDIMRSAHAYGRLTDIPFIPRDSIQKKYIDKLQEENKAIKYQTEFSKLDFIELKARNPHATIYSIDILQPNFDNLLAECEEFFGSQNDAVSTLAIKDLFGFEGKKFWLKRIAGENLTISFTPKSGETTDPFCLMQALVHYIKSYGNVKDGYLTTIVPVQEITDYIKKNYKNINTNDWSTWIKYTKNNLLKKMTDEDKKLITIKNFDKQDGGYPFSIKLPLSTP